MPWPAAGSSVIFTLASVSPSLSEWLKSVAENAWSVSSSVVTMPFDAVGALLGSGVCAGGAASVVAETAPDLSPVPAALMALTA